MVSNAKIYHSNTYGAYTEAKIDTSENAHRVSNHNFLS